MPSSPPPTIRPLPRVLAPLTRTAPRVVFRGEGRLGRRLARSRISGDAVYRGGDGLAFRADPTDDFQLLMLLGLYDTAVVDEARRYARPGSVAIDAGAFLGYVSLHLARAVGPAGTVHAFECDPRILPRLREHLQLNAAGVVQLHEQAITREVGSADFVLREQVGWSSVGEDSAVGPAVRTLEVPTTSLDAALDRAGVRAADVSFIKLDVEGQELPALDGMVQTLRDGDPAIVVEVFPDRLDRLGTGAAQVHDFMRELGYEGRIPRPLHTVAVRGAARTRPASVHDWGDVLFVRPARRRAAGG